MQSLSTVESELIALCFCLSLMNSSLVDIQPEVSDALKNGRPVVALESTIITHGMPHPHNLETAVNVENIVREQVRAVLQTFLHSRRISCCSEFCNHHRTHNVDLHCMQMTVEMRLCRHKKIEYFIILTDIAFQSPPNEKIQTIN